VARIEEHLQKWTDANVIPADVAERILAFERERDEAGESPHTARTAPTSSESRPGALEALLYLGLVVLLVGVYALIGQQWEDLDSWARVSVIAVPMVLMFGLGALLQTRAEPELQRGSQAAWFLTVGLFGGFLLRPSTMALPGP
jgi:hypothetical protein